MPLVLGLAALGALLFASGRRKPPTLRPKAASEKLPPDAVLARMALVMGSQDAPSVREEIARLRREGWHRQARELETKVLPKLEKRAA